MAMIRDTVIWNFGRDHSPWEVKRFFSLFEPFERHITRGFSIVCCDGRDGRRCMMLSDAHQILDQIQITELVLRFEQHSFEYQQRYETPGLADSHSHRLHLAGLGGRKTWTDRNVGMVHGLLVRERLAKITLKYTGVSEDLRTFFTDLVATLFDSATTESGTSVADSLEARLDWDVGAKDFAIYITRRISRS